MCAHVHSGNTGSPVHMDVHSGNTDRPVHMANSVNTSFVPVSSCGQWREGNNPASSPHSSLCCAVVVAKYKGYNTTASLLVKLCCVSGIVRSLAPAKASSAPCF